MFTDHLMAKTLSIELNAIWRASIQGGTVLLLAWIISRIWTRMPAIARVWLWRAAYLELAVSLCWAGTIIVPMPSISSCRVYSPHVDHIKVSPLISHLTSKSVRQQTGADIKSPQIDTDSDVDSNSNRNVGYARYIYLLFLVWVCGIGWNMLRILLGMRYVRRLKKSCYPIKSSEIYAVLVDLSQRMGIKRLPAIAACDGITPMLMGVLKPSIIIPAEQLQAGNIGNLNLILAHELAHFRHKDLMWNRLTILIETLFFFHPLIWIASRENQLAQEIACDESAVRITGAAGTDYAKMLVDTATRPTRSFRLTPSTAGISESFITLKRRLQAMRWNRGITRMQVLVIGIVAVLLGVTLAAWRIVPHTHPKGIYGTTLKKLIVSPDGNHIAVQYEEDLTTAPGKRIYAGSIKYNTTVEVRNFTTGKLEQEVLYKNIYGIKDLAFSSDSRALYVSQNKRTWGPSGHLISTCYRLDIGSGKLGKAIDDTGALWISRNENTLWTEVASPCVKGEDAGPTSLVKRDLRTGRELRKLPPINGFLKSISPDGTKAVTNHYYYNLASDRSVIGYRNVSLIVWNLTTGKKLITLEGKNKYPCYAVAFSSDGNRYAAAEQSESAHQESLPVRVWDVRSGKVICTLGGNIGNVRRVTFSPDGKKLAGVDDNGQVILWDVVKGKTEWLWQDNGANNIVFSSDGKQIIAGSDLNTATSSQPKWCPGFLTILNAETGLRARTIEINN